MNPNKYLFFILGLLCCLILPIQKAEASCRRLAKKMCKNIGKRSFLCGVYKRIAKDKRADHKHCRRLLRNHWKRRLKSFQRSESTLRQMDKLAQQSGAGNRQKVNQYKRMWSNCRIAQMRRGAKQEPKACRRFFKSMKKKRGKKRASRLPCRQLALLVCRDIGLRSFYCRLFSKLTSRPGVKPRKCLLFVNNWASSQRYSYQKREKTLQWMIKLSRKKPSARAQVAATKKMEVMNLYRFLYQ